MGPIPQPVSPFQLDSFDQSHPQGQQVKPQSAVHQTAFISSSCREAGPLAGGHRVSPVAPARLEELK